MTSQVRTRAWDLLTDLTSAMGINRPSLYATYGNKRDLFIQAIDRYAATHH